MCLCKSKLRKKKENEILVFINVIMLVENTMRCKHHSEDSESSG